jgi:aryl-alcohol dehydrogenase-like predicted oxidoreductase
MSRLPRRRLGRTGLTVAALGLGAMDTPHSPEARETVEAALDAEIDFIDTAREYAGSEFLLGQVIRARGSASFHVASKTFSRTMDGSQHDVDRSLSTLGLERITLYQLHDVSTPEAWEQVHREDGALAGLREMRDYGFVSHIGISTHSMEVLRRVVDSDGFDSVMVEYSAFHPQTGALIEAAHARDIGVIVMRPLGGSGRTSELRGRIAEGYAGPLTPANLLRYALSHPGVSTVIPGARHPSRIVENVRAAVDFTPMPPDERQALEEEASRLYA